MLQQPQQPHLVLLFLAHLGLIHNIVEHKPFSTLQVSGVLIITDLTSASITVLAYSSVIKVPSANKISFETGSIISSAITLPVILSSKDSINSFPDVISVISIPSCVPQSSAVILTFWETSISFLVKYPAFAVLSAVSASPFLAPWVEIKYSRTFNPSLKLEIIGVSIIVPSGFKP